MEPIPLEGLCFCYLILKPWLRVTQRSNFQDINLQAIGLQKKAFKKVGVVYLTWALIDEMIDNNGLYVKPNIFFRK